MVSEVTIPKNSKQTLLLVEKVTVQKLVIDSYFYSLKLVSTIVGRGFLTPLFYGDPVPPKLLTSPPPFFQVFGLMGDRATFDVLFDLMILGIYTCQALLP